MNSFSRRHFLQRSTAAAAAWSLLPAIRNASALDISVRKYHVSISVEALEHDPDLIAKMRDAGASTLWLAGFFYGYWPVPPERLETWLGRIREAKLDAQMIDIPLGHPGDSLGSSSGDFPLTAPKTWKVGVRPDGTTYAGTSLHPPATEENAAAVKRIAAMGVKRLFLDDDFRLAQAPSQIGGCFCDTHRRAFLDKHGYPDARWPELLDDVKNRRFTPLLRAWVDSNCDELTGCFRAMQAAAPDIDLGIMVMYCGAERAGIRLADYRNALMRVGEGMFSDNWFGTPKAKTVELFSVLFHRRYVTPERAFSETTAYPSDNLSAPNMAAKLAISTIANVRNTMFMSGLTPFPKAHWDTLAPAMKKNADIHAVLAGHAPRGPFKHYWGEPSRYADDDNPFSLFLATGVPFEVIDAPGDQGFVFLSHIDAQEAAAGRLKNGGAKLVARPESNAKSDAIRTIKEELGELFALKREIIGSLRDTPYVAEDKPVVCGWYPTARAALLWNLAEQPETFTVCFNDTRRTVTVDALGIELVRDLGTA
jgi:hypothetical protein